MQYCILLIIKQGVPIRLNFSIAGLKVYNPRTQELFSFHFVQGVLEAQGTEMIREKCTCFDCLPCSYMLRNISNTTLYMAVNTYKEIQR
jgi:hypothetical protein